MTLAREGTSAGNLAVSTGDWTPETTAEVPSNRELPFDVPGLLIREFIVPFQDLLRTRSYDGSRGFAFRAHSAARRSASEYVENIFSFFVTFPSQGGGVVRLTDLVDLVNPSLVPNAGVPSIGSSNEELRDENRERVSDENVVMAYRRVHAGGDVAQVDAAARIRADRLANFNLQPVAGGDELLGLAPGRVIGPMQVRRDPLPRYMRDLGLDDA